MTARRDILAAVARHRRNDIALPAIHGDWLHPEVRVEDFCDAVVAVGGRVVPVENEKELVRVLAQDRVYQGASTLVSQIAGLPSRGVDEEETAILQGRVTLDITVAESPLAVAENGAVYLEPIHRSQHAMLFLCEHLYVVVPTHAIVATMHHAYDWLDQARSAIAATPSRPGFGLFVSGPSKTADIEQALVIGAQGPRSLTILLTGR